MTVKPASPARRAGEVSASRPHVERERALERRGIWPVAGVDEAGRGPLAGPVCAAAVVLDLTRVPEGLNDSKLLNASRREALFDEIARTAVAIAVAFASVDEIDATDIRQATHAAMRRAVAALSHVPARVLIDGNDLPVRLACAGETIIKGDRVSSSVAAASIIAKVARDRLMRRACVLQPAYGFSRHAGYATPQHLAALTAHGPCTLHRRTFAPVRNLLAAAAHPTGS